MFSLRDSPELDPVFVWIQAPSLTVLEERIRGRGDTDEEALRKRMTTARWEFEQCVGGRFERAAFADADTVRYS